MTTVVHLLAVIGIVVAILVIKSTGSQSSTGLERTSRTCGEADHDLGAAVGGVGHGDAAVVCGCDR
jgi:hypothetical protein